MGVLQERRGAAALVILDWPEQRNALGPDECERGSRRRFAAAADDPAVCGIVVTGNGAFCAGGNLRGAVERQSMDPDERRRLVYGAYQGLIRALVDVPVPTVAALDGPAVGMGLDIALACDVRVVGPAGWAQQGWGKVGLVAATGGVLLLRRRAPGALWPLLASQDRLDGPRLAALDLGRGRRRGHRPRACRQRSSTAWRRRRRRALEAYVELDREDLRRDLDAHLAVAVGHQVGLLGSPEFAERVARTLR